MKTKLIKLIFIFLFISCTKANDSEPAKIVAPTDFKIETLSLSAIKLTWKDNSILEEGYKIEKAENGGDFAVLKVTGADVQEYTDRTLVAGGNYIYRISSFKGSEISPVVEISYSSTSVPSITIGTPSASSYMITVPYTITESGGLDCESGICWSTSADPTIEQSKFTYFKALKSGGAGYGNALNLNYGQRYFIRAYAKNSMGITYSSVVEAMLQDAPQPLSLPWQIVTNFQSQMPTEVKLYNVTTNVAGRPVKAWYAEADLSTGKVELRTLYSSVAKTPSDFVKSQTDEIYALTNGGYFASGVSYSFLRDKGVNKATNIAVVNRTYSYTITRGALGVDQNQTPSINWLFSDNGSHFAYTKPLPVVDGEYPLAPTVNFPSPRTEYSAYSAIGGGPVLMREGRICYDFSTIAANKYKTNHELLQSDIFAPSQLQPRTAIGFSADKKKIYLMVVDGRDPGISEGVTLDELTKMMMGVGCSDIMNLDGGGSSAIVATNQGVLLNNPSDYGNQRPVYTFVGFGKRQ